MSDTLHLGWVVLIRKGSKWLPNWDNMVHFDKDSAAIEAAAAQKEGWHSMVAELRTISEGNGA